MDISDEDSLDISTSFIVSTSQVETQGQQDEEGILRSLPALQLPKPQEPEEKTSALSSEDENRNPLVLVKDSESEFEEKLKKRRLLREDERDIKCVDSFSDEEVDMVSPSASDNDGNVTVVCVPQLEKPSTSGAVKESDYKIQVSESPAEDDDANDVIFQSQGFQVTSALTTASKSSSDDSNDKQPSQVFQSLQLSGDAMLVPETFDQSIPDSQEMILSTPMMIPDSPTDNDSVEENKAEEEEKSSRYDPTGISTFKDVVEDSLPPTSPPVQLRYSNSNSDTSPKKPDDIEIGEDDSQDLALRLSPSQPYLTSSSRSQTEKSPSLSQKQKTPEMKTDATGSFHLVVPTHDEEGNVSKSSSTSPDSKLTTSPNVSAEFSAVSSLNLNQMETQSETSDTSFHLKVPTVPDVNLEESSEQNVFKKSKPSVTAETKKTHPVIEESSEDIFAFERIKKRTGTEEITEKGDNPVEKAFEADTELCKETQESVDSNAETQPSNEDCEEFSKQSIRDSCSKEREITPEKPGIAADKSIEMIEVDESVIVLDTQDERTSDSQSKSNEDNQPNVTIIPETLTENDSENNQNVLQKQSSRQSSQQADSMSVHTQESGGRSNSQTLSGKQHSVTVIPETLQSVPSKDLADNGKPNISHKSDQTSTIHDSIHEEKSKEAEESVPNMDQPTLISDVQHPASLSSEVSLKTTITDPYSFHGTQSQGHVQHEKSLASASGKVKGILASAKRYQKVSMRRLSSRRQLPPQSSSTEGQTEAPQKPVPGKRKRLPSKRENRKSRKEEASIPCEQSTSTITQNKKDSLNTTPHTTTRHISHTKSLKEATSGSGHQKRVEFEGLTRSPLHTSSSSQEESLEYCETTVHYRIVTIDIKKRDGTLVCTKTRKEQDDIVIIKRKISKEDLHQYESPTRSSSTLGSGELGDVESLSRSNSSNSKASNPSSLEKMSPSLEMLSPSVKSTASHMNSTNTTLNSHSDAANTPNESPIEVSETVDGNPGGVEVSDVLFTSPDTSDAGKKSKTSSKPTASHENTSSVVVEKKAADSSSQDTSEIECGQRPKDGGHPDESDGFSVHGSCASSVSSRHENYCLTPTGRGSLRKTSSATSKLSRSKSSTTTTDSSKQSPEIPVQSDRPITSARHTCYVSKKEKGANVMAKWKDGYFYPGKIVAMETTRIRVQFDDGDVKFVKNADVLLVSQLPIGQSVMVLSSDGYFDTGMILNHSLESEEILYEVETDNGEKHRYSHSQVILSEGQAACLMSDEEIRVSPSDPIPSTSINQADLSLDNLVEGKRSCSKSKKPVESVRSVMPEPESSDVKRQGRKRKLREGGPMATSTPTPKGKKQEPVSKKGKKSPKSPAVSGVVDSPSCSQTRHSRFRVGLFEGSRRIVCDPATVKETLFQGMAFFLTHVTKTYQQKKEEKKQLQDSSLEVSEESSNDEEDVPPFDKVELKQLITAGGGVLLDKYNQEQIDQYRQCFIISDTHQRTVKYFQGLAAGLPCVSHLWILYSCSQGQIIDYKSYILPAGIDIERKKLSEWNECGSCLAGMKILVHSSNTEFVDAWSSVLTIGRCSILTRFPAAKSNVKPDVVVTDKSCSNQIKKKAGQSSIPTVSTEWVIQCLITGRKVDYEGHPRYQPDN